MKLQVGMRVRLWRNRGTSLHRSDGTGILRRYIGMYGDWEQ